MSNMPDPQTYTTLRTVGSLTRFQADTTTPRLLVEQLHAHLVTEWGVALTELEGDNLLRIDGSRIYLTTEGAELAAKLTRPAGDIDLTDCELVVTQATNLECFGASYSSSEPVCEDCPVKVLCQESEPTRRAEAGFVLQLGDDEERRRLEAIEAARRRQAEVEAERASRTAARENAPSLQDVYTRLLASAEAKKAQQEAEPSS